MSLTSDHLIYERTAGYIKAEYVKLNDELQVIVSNNGSFLFSKVISINEKIENGFIAPLTENGNLIVNGVHASCYTLNSHSFAHFMLKPLVYWYKLRKFFHYEQIESKEILKESFLHRYIGFLKYSGLKDFADVLF